MYFGLFLQYPWDVLWSCLGCLHDIHCYMMFFLIILVVFMRCCTVYFWLYSLDLSRGINVWFIFLFYNIVTLCPNSVKVICFRRLYFFSSCIIFCSSWINICTYIDGLFSIQYLVNLNLIFLFHMCSFFSFKRTKLYYPCLYALNFFLLYNILLHLYKFLYNILFH